MQALGIQPLSEERKIKIPLLSLVWHLFSVVSGNRHLPRGSNCTVLCTTANVFVAR